MVLKMLKVENDTKYKNITHQYGFINPNEGSNIVREISPIRTHNFISFFQHLKKKHYKVSIYFAPELKMFKRFILSGFTLNIKRFVYAYMLHHEDNRIRRWRSK